MKLSKTFKKLLLEEIELVIDKMDSSESPQEVMYYFSAIYGAIQRILNFEFHNELVHLWVILNPLYQTLNQKFLEPQTSFDNANPARMERLVELVGRLKEGIQNDDKLTDLAQDFAVLLYSTNGNGNFLLHKGLLKLKD